MLFFFKQKTAYEMRISDWSSDVCSSDLLRLVAADLGGHRVDEERHVVVDDLDHAVLRFPAILGRIGIVGADACLAGGALLQPLPQGKGAAGQVVGGAAAQVAWRHVGEELPQERLRALGRSDEHTSELQSLMRISSAVFCLKKKKTKKTTNTVEMIRVKYDARTTERQRLITKRRTEL